MKVLLDLNVLLDVIQHREPHYDASAAVLSRIAEDELEGAVPGHALTTVYYLVSRFADRGRAARAVDWILRDLEVVAEDRELFLRARSLDLDDFEDAVVASAAERASCDRIVTRNVHDFAGSPVPAITPGELVAEITAPPEESSEEPEEGSNPAPGRDGTTS